MYNTYNKVGNFMGYFETFKYNESSLINDNETKAISRHEVTVNLKQIVKTASYMLKKFYIVEK